MNSVWDESELGPQLVLQAVPTASSVDALLPLLDSGKDDVSRLQLHLTGLDDYVASWGIRAGVWVVLAVVRLIKTTLANDAPDVAIFGCVPPDTFVILAPEVHQQKIGHHCLNGYQEIYATLLRTHRQPSSPIWHKRAYVQRFPQLELDIDTTATALDELNEE